MSILWASLAGAGYALCAVLMIITYVADARRGGPTSLDSQDWARAFVFVGLLWPLAVVMVALDAISDMIAP